MYLRYSNENSGPRHADYSQKSYISPQGSVVKAGEYDRDHMRERLLKKASNGIAVTCFAPVGEGVGCKDIRRGEPLFGVRSRHGVSSSLNRLVFSSWNDIWVPNERVNKNLGANPPNDEATWKKKAKNCNDYLNEKYELVGIAETDSKVIDADLVTQDPAYFLGGLVEVVNNSGEVIGYGDRLIVTIPEVVVKTVNGNYALVMENATVGLGIASTKVIGVVKSWSKAFGDPKPNPLGDLFRWYSLGSEDEDEGDPDLLNAINLDNQEMVKKRQMAFIDQLNERYINNIIGKALGTSRSGEHFSMLIEHKAIP